MTDLQSTFYIIGIIYMVINVVLLIGVGVGIIFIFRSIRKMHKKIEDKVKYVENLIKHPEDAIADMGASLIRRSVGRVKDAIRRKRASSD